MEQTAVEWLIENSHIIPKNELNKRELIEQANKMFEQQIIEAYYEGKQYGFFTEEQYYNETFKQKP
jgi:hypothetical protein